MSAPGTERRGARPESGLRTAAPLGKRRSRPDPRDQRLRRLEQEVLRREEELGSERARSAALDRRWRETAMQLAAIESSTSWRWTQPLRALQARLRRSVLYPLFRGRRHRIFLQPMAEIVEEGEQFRSLGRHPRLELFSSKVEPPGGWVEIALASGPGSEQLDPVLWVHHGDARPDTPVPLGRVGAARVHRRVRLPEPVVGLSLQPMAAPGAIDIQELAIRELGRIEVAVRRRLPRRRRPESVRAAVPGARPEPTPPPADPYERWVAAHDRLTTEDRQQISLRIGGFSFRPRFTVVLPLCPGDGQRVARSVESLRRQLYPRWELIPAAAGDRPAVMPSDLPVDPRLQPPAAAAAGREEAIRRALARARGDYLLLLEPGDRLAEHAFYLLAEAAGRRPRPALVYADEDSIDAVGRRSRPLFKPDLDRDLLYSANYLGRGVAWSTALARRLGGPRPELEGAEVYDLALRATEAAKAAPIVHVPWVLYHRGRRAADGDGARREAERRALLAHLERTGSRARVREQGAFRRLLWAVPEPPPRVTAIVPTRNRVDLLARCVEGLLEDTDYPALDVLIVDNESDEPATRRYLRRIARRRRVQVLEVPGPFNYSRVNNRAVEASSSPLLALLNNDLEVVEPGWLREMVAHALRPEIGGVGAQLRYPSGDLQHAGVVLGSGGVAALRHRGRRDPSAASHDPWGLASRNLSSVTAACMVLRRRVFEEVGGFDEESLAVAFNDVDLCLKIVERGYRLVFTPYARLIHHESQSLGRHDRPERARRFQEEVRIMQIRWGGQLGADPYYSPNLSLELGRDYDLADPPRRSPPWR